jgi:hypothetical protein
MPYSIIAMRYALQQLGMKKGDEEVGKKDDKPFVWERDDLKGVVNPALAAQFKYGRRKNPLNDLLEYCWLVYSKALHAAGSQLIGRTEDLWVPAQLNKVGIKDKDTETLWESFTAGNIQIMEKWSPTVNDSWVLGGVHRQAEFELVSMRSLKNLWDYSKNLPIVTAREILGMLHFGYKLEQREDRVYLICQNPVAAQDATLEAYDSLMDQVQAKGANSIVTLLKMNPALQNQIQSFDKSKLKPPVPPR